jgi:hypothetical protein
MCRSRSCGPTRHNPLARTPRRVKHEIFKLSGLRPAVIWVTVFLSVRLFRNPSELIKSGSLVAYIFLARIQPRALLIIHGHDYRVNDFSKLLLTFIGIGQGILIFIDKGSCKKFITPLQNLCYYLTGDNMFAVTIDRMV